MKRTVWSVADCIVSPLGVTSEENYAKIRKGISRIRLVTDKRLGDEPLCVSWMGDVSLSDGATRFETLCLEALQGALDDLKLPPHRTLFILSTTKGNIELLDRDVKDHPRIHLHAVASHLATAVGFTRSLVVSNACISGVLALQVAQRFLQSGQYDHAVVLGADVLSRFVISGFRSLQALSPEPCKPFDRDRTGITLGEAAAVMVLSASPDEIGAKRSIRLGGAGLSNDANHISGPSRTGEELAMAIKQALGNEDADEAGIDFISAHGTATLYNDEMEAKAFKHAGLSEVPLNSLKGYFGHTLGAAGIVETIVSAHSLLHDEMIPTKGFDTMGVTTGIRVCHTLTLKSMRRLLKTASGFGGCNAALVIEKEK